MSQQRKRTKLRQRHVHKYVAKVAQEAANEHYEVLMGASNELFAEWKRQNPGANDAELRKRFVVKHWGKYVEFARATLARILATSTDDHLRETIYEALCLDATLMRGREKPLPTVMEWLQQQKGAIR